MKLEADEKIIGFQVTVPPREIFALWYIEEEDKIYVELVQAITHTLISSKSSRYSDEQIIFNNVDFVYMQDRNWLTTSDDSSFIGFSYEEEFNREDWTKEIEQVKRMNAYREKKRKIAKEKIAEERKKHEAELATMDPEDAEFLKELENA